MAIKLTIVEAAKRFAKDLKEGNLNLRSFENEILEQVSEQITIGKGEIKDLKKRLVKIKAQGSQAIVESLANIDGYAIGTVDAREKSSALYIESSLRFIENTKAEEAEIEGKIGVLEEKVKSLEDLLNRLGSLEEDLKKLQEADQL